uniref:Ricin b lectin n=1 Tax=Colletotrichum fructicola (strain Nara gc5) TaxID=1213859 RepID=L2GE90_COLFN
MKLSLLAVFAASVSVAQSAITWTLDKAANPTSDQIEAYEKIEATMKAAVARHAKLGTASKSVTVKYTPGGVSGVLRFGSDRAFMDERTALHEIAHKLGVGLTTAFNSLCSSGDWKTALPLLKSWDGDDAKISCGGQHIWPLSINAMIANGM